MMQNVEKMEKANAQTKTWFVTGINRGLGRKLAEALLERGDRVAGTARNVGELDALKAKFGKQLWIASLDVTEPQAIERVVDAAFAELGRIDVIINNAGYSLLGTAEECSAEMIRQQFEANLFGSIFVIKAALPHLRAQRGGRILQVSSAVGQLAAPGLAFYVASKWGIEGFIEATAMDVAPFGIEMTIFEPGAIRTDFGSTGVIAPPLAAYEGTPASAMRRAAESLRHAGVGSSAASGDPAKMARVMIESIEQSPAPKRIAMGSDIYDALLATYRSRAAELEGQKVIAYSTDH